MRTVLINQWQATGYLLLLTGLLTYAATLAPYWSAAFGLSAGAVLLAPLGLSQVCLRLGRGGLAYFFALQAALIYALIFLVGGMELLAAHLLTAFDGVLRGCELALVGTAAASALSAALALRAVIGSASRLDVHSGRVRVGGGAPDAVSAARSMV